MIFDTHSHYTDEQFSDRDELLTKLNREKNVSEIITCGTDIESSKESISLAEKFPFVYAAVGFHPEELTRCDTNIPALRQLITDKVVAIGEIGLDYYWNKENKEKQKEGFISQIKLAQELNLPVIVHDREAHGDTLEILKAYKPKGVLHCFSGSVEMAKEIIKLGMYIGIGGVITFKNAKNLPEVVETLPLDRLLLETDAPYLAPVPFRSKRNDSSLIPYIAEKIGDIKGISKEEILKITRENAYNLFFSKN
ncbi:MAG: TatD family hydrolase [Acutalibacteraceae bacterium]|nr:TatD family hydrolase [Acutalibacteraceae bacterium]